MADFTTLEVQWNTNATSDTNANWTGQANGSGIPFYATGSQPATAGTYELRWQRSNATLMSGALGGATTGQASWPYMIIPSSGTAAVEQCWGFVGSNNSGGAQAARYDGTHANSNVFRIHFDNLATPVTAMQLSAFPGFSNANGTVGTQTAQNTDGQNILNGQTTDTSNTSYLKVNVYGSGYPSGGSQETPTAGGAIGTAPAATTGTAGSVTSTAANWLNANAAWQSAQWWNQYITAASVLNATTAGFWYFSLVLFIGANIQTGTMLFSAVTVQYTYT